MPTIPVTSDSDHLDSDFTSSNATLIKESVYDDVQFTVASDGAGDTLHLYLKQDSSVRISRGRLMAASGNVRIQNRMKKTLRAILGPDDARYQTLSVRSDEKDDIKNTKSETTGTEKSNTDLIAWGILAPPFLGTISGLKMQGDVMCVANGAVLATIGDIETEIKGQGLKSALFSGGAMFVKVLKGTGFVFLAAVGAISVVTVNDAEDIIVDPGHLLAWPKDAKVSMQRTGEGFLAGLSSDSAFCAISGPAVIYLQSRKGEDFASWIYDSKAPPTRGPLGVPGIPG